MNHAWKSGSLGKAWLRGRCGTLIALALLAGVIGGSVVSVAQQAAPAGQSERQKDGAPARADRTPAAPGKSAASAAEGSPSSPDEALLPLTSDQVAAHLGETADWFHHLAPIEQLQVAADDSVARDRLHQQALTAARLAFDFGKACVVLLNEQARRAESAAGESTSSAAGGKSTAETGKSTAGEKSSAEASKPSAEGKSSSEAGKAPAGAGKPSAAAPTAKGFAGRLDQAAADVAQRIDALQAQLDTIKEQINRARGKERATLSAQEGQVTAALQLAREVQSSVQDMENFEASSIAGDNGNLSPLEGQILDMERSIPELRATSGGSRFRSRVGETGAVAAGTASGGAKGSAAGTASTNGSNTSASGGGGTSGTGASGSTSGNGSSGSGASGASTSRTATSGTSAAHPASTFRPENAGVIALLTEWFSLHDTRRQLNDYIKETNDLQDETEKVRGRLVAQVRVVMGDDLAISTLTDPNQLVAQRQELEADTARFKQLSTVLVPLGEQALTVESALSTLDDWKSTLATRMANVVRYLLIRIGIVLGWIAVVLIVSDIWRRATFRYLHDQRRRRQFLVLRRVAVGVALTLVIVFGLVSEIGSIATYIGFVTAGVAVALQNVILAVVAYFFLIGRYGVRVGDRITLSGVTGRVVDIGLVRIYLMELAGADLHATGRMVVLSNAVLFQPTAMFKQIPGAEYIWHTVTLTIAATADVVAAHKRLKAAAEEVYQKYRPAIERQHQMVQRFIDFDASSPQPEVRLRLTENGLECSVRYPVELENAAVIDQQMLKALRDALEHDQQFKLVATGAVVLKSSDS
jgi:small-conductance mechanosensitive channel